VAATMSGLIVGLCLVGVLSAFVPVTLGLRGWARARKDLGKTWDPNPYSFLMGTPKTDDVLTKPDGPPDDTETT
jgi:hypothetical protein